MSKFAYLNSSFIKFRDAKIHIEDRGLQFSDSVYEVVSFYNQQLIDFDFHIKRLKYSLKELKIKYLVNQDKLRKIFNKIMPKNQDIYLQYNTSALKNGYYLYFPEKLQLEDPIIIKHVIDQGNPKSFLNYRNFIHADNNVKVSLLNKEIFLIDHCINTACEVYLDHNTQVELINYSEKPQTKQIYNFAADINKNSKLKYHAIDMFGRLLKNNYYINLSKPESECLFNGFNIADNKDHIDNYIEVNHNSPHTLSNLNYKIIANKNAKGILFAKAIINKNSFDSEAYQKNNNLILSDKAAVHSNPQLEIYNDNVKCSHGSATGQIDDEAIYYMRSRGINEETAKQLILNSFVNDIIENISSKTIQDIFKKRVANYLKNEYQH